MKLFLPLAGVLLTLTLVSCFSNQKKDEKSEQPRSPSSYGNIDTTGWDDFAKDGLAHNQDGNYTNRKFQDGAVLSDAQQLKELAGREIWFKSSPNERFHTYYFPQKLNSPIAWYKVLRADRHDKRFDTWGLINDPDCCVPGKTCDQRGMKYNGRSVTMQDTFGWEYCQGDEQLLDIVHGKRPATEWRDPACDHPVVKAADALDNQARENRCELAFGNPTGAVGYRKFPNPKFNKQRWESVAKKWKGQAADLNTAGWLEFERRMREEQLDASVEPPFRVAKSCASCHAAFDPLNPPKDKNNPTWKNLKAETGNQYLNISAILGSGAREDAIEYQMFVHTRAGTVDTSAVPNDFVNNPGTINAIINIPKRPVFSNEVVTRWVNVPNCSGPSCQVVKFKDTEGKEQQKYWKYMTGPMDKIMPGLPMFHILKGSEDSVGPDLAVQRVYVNIGMCAEQCWVNHLPNMKEFDKAQRGYDQTPFNIQQCRQDCASWRANEDRVGDIFAYLMSRRPTDLKDAKFKQTPEVMRDQNLSDFLDKRYGGENLVEKGKNIFAQNCTQCHSSQNQEKSDMSKISALTDIDLMATETLDSGEIIRTDWLGNDQSTRADEVGTYKCRSLHSNHMKGRVWEHFGSDTNKSRPQVFKNLRGTASAGGRGYYRNISLLNLWAHAPFMHNNAVGPEICGNVANEPEEFRIWRATVNGKQTDAKNKYLCDMYFDPSIEGRYKLFEKSVDELLTPSKDRIKKVALTDKHIKFPLGISINFLKDVAPLALEFPVGMPANSIVSLDLKSFGTDLKGAVPFYEAYVKALEAKNENQQKEAQASFQKYWTDLIQDSTAAKELANASWGTFEHFRKMFAEPLKIKEAGQAWLAELKRDENQRLKTYLKYYTNCDAYYENEGHDFGTQLSADEKTALKAFLATL